MIAEEVWQKGLPIDQYIEKMEYFKKEMKQRVAEVYITSSEFQRLKNFPEKRKILVLSDARCKDSLMNLPIVAKLVEASPLIEMKLYFRNENTQLWDYFYQNGIKNIPIIWIMKEDYTFCGVWVERPKAAYRMIDEWMKSHPEYSFIKNDESLSDEIREVKLKPLSDQLLDDMWNWYDTILQSDTVKEILTVLES